MKKPGMDIEVRDRLELLAQGVIAGCDIQSALDYIEKLETYIEIHGKFIQDLTSRLNMSKTLARRIMTYLTGKRFKRIDGAGGAARLGTIISEPFREPHILNKNDDEPTVDWATCVAILWNDGNMEGAVDIEELKVLEEDVGYVVAVTWAAHEDGELILETYMKYSSLEDARKRAGGLSVEKQRIGKVIFPFE